MKLPGVLAAIGALVFIGILAAFWFWTQVPVSRTEYDPPKEALHRLLEFRTLQTDVYQAALRDGKEPSFGTLRKIIESSKWGGSQFNWKSDSEMEYQEYQFAIHLPDPPERATTWCAIAWPASEGKQKEWPSYFVEQGMSIYQSKKPLGRRPMLTDLYEGKPFVTRVPVQSWTLRMQ